MRMPSRDYSTTPTIMKWWKLARRSHSHTGAGKQTMEKWVPFLGASVKNYYSSTVPSLLCSYLGFQNTNNFKDPSSTTKKSWLAWLGIKRYRPQGPKCLLWRWSGLSATYTYSWPCAFLPICTSTIPFYLAERLLKHKLHMIAGWTHPGAYIGPFTCRRQQTDRLIALPLVNARVVRR